jgi:(S)-2-hydroxyglutarate dehydrogenase
VGGGIIGVAIARELAARHPSASIVLMEKEHSVAEHASGRNSGVLHSGVYYSPESFKAKLTRAGNVFLHEYIEEKGMRINKCGKLIVARDESEVRLEVLVRMRVPDGPLQLASLDELMKRGRANGVPVEKITAKEANELEVSVCPLFVRLSAPTDPPPRSRWSRPTSMRCGLQRPLLQTRCR